MNLLYCTIDHASPIDQFEIARLRTCFNVTVITPGDAGPALAGPPAQTMQHGKHFYACMRLWVKVCTLLAALPASNIAQRFAERNVYQKSSLLTHFINAIWKIKLAPAVNAHLPNFAKLAYLFPFGKRSARDLIDACQPDLVLYNSLVVTAYPFIALLKQCKTQHIQRVANVRSWDNPYYLQFDSSADRYLVWSEFMAHTISASQHGLKLDAVAWGPNILKNFYDPGSAYCRTPRAADSAINIGYAAAFGEAHAGLAEFRLISRIANFLNSHGVRCTVLYRPYPTVAIEQFLAHQESEHVELCCIDANIVDRYGDGRELIRFGTPLEKKRFLDACDLFLSLGTTFTLEAIIHGAPVIHYFLPAEKRLSADEHLIFNRVEITCDHFDSYFAACVESITTATELIGCIHKMQSSASNHAELLARIGLDNLDSDAQLERLKKPWPHSQAG